MKNNRKMILTAGPSITEKEIDYVSDAVKNGWNENWNGYITKFEKAFAAFAGCRHALATSSCTGAMHLALLALGVGAGDEVIMPDLAWVATANAVKYVGAEPVMVDVLDDTWCLDPEKVKKAVNKKTKAIAPVHLYGHPCEMDEINAIAKENGIFVMEDAAQAIGSLYKDKRPGSLGDVGCFSFQGAKTLVTGEGGMLVTDSDELYEKARFYNNHGRDPKGSFWILEVGYKYKISNIQAALGLAQLERVGELTGKKRQIYKWYSERLKDVPGIRLNFERDYVKSNYWMTSMVLDKKFSVSRDGLMKALREKYLIDSRTFYYPMSEFKPFKSSFGNPVAKKLSGDGINLPSGHNLTEDHVDYIAKSIKEMLS